MLYVELIPGVPLLVLLYAASVMFPLFMPPGVNIDKLLHAQVAFILFAAAYLAEVVRGGLQELAKGHAEADEALASATGRRRASSSCQALCKVILPLVSTFTGFFEVPRRT